jgi:hypothetical protein
MTRFRSTQHVVLFSTLESQRLSLDMLDQLIDLSGTPPPLGFL